MDPYNIFEANDYVRPTRYHAIIIVPTAKGCALSPARRCESKQTMNVMDGTDVMNIGGPATMPPQRQTTDQQSITAKIHPRLPTAPTTTCQATTRDGATTAGSNAAATPIDDLHFMEIKLRPCPQRSPSTTLTRTCPWRTRKTTTTWII